MSAPVDTSNEGHGESQLDEWLQQNRLENVRDKFKQNRVILQDLIDLSTCSINELKIYARDALGLNLMEQNRFAKAVASFKPKQQKKQNRIILTAEEGVAIEKMNKRQQEIKGKMNKSTADIQTLTQLSKTNEDDINAIHKEVIHKLNERFAALISTSNTEINKKKHMIGNYIQELQTYDTSLTDADSQCDALLMDDGMNKSKRKTKIVNISQNILKTRINEVNITAKVSVEINKAAVLQYIQSIGNINNYNYPVHPIISMHNIQTTSATIKLDNMDNVEDISECCVQLCEHYGDDDEKKHEGNWKQICCVKNENKYCINALNDDTMYGVRAQYKNKYGFGKLCSPLSFKTKKLQRKSSILTPLEIESFFALLSTKGKQLGKTWNLIYKASRDGNNKEAFVSKCYGKPRLLCIVHTKGNNVCGGYTSTGWKHGVQNGHSKDDKAFVFGIRSSKNYAPLISSIKPNSKYGDKALGYHNDYYLLFGYSFILYINISDTSYITHQNPYQDNYEAFPNSLQLLGGNSYEKINEIEVFQVS